VDAYWQRIYKWATESAEPVIVRDNPLDPVNLVFDKAGNLIVVSSGGQGMTVYSFKPGTPEDQTVVLPPEPATENPGMAAVLPPSYWVNGDGAVTLSTTDYTYTTLEQMFSKVVSNRKTYQYVSPDRTLFIPTDAVLLQGPPYFGTKFAYVLQSFGLVRSVAGHPFYVTNESEEKTYVGTVNADGTLSGFKLFANQGGECAAQDTQGNVYLAAGQIYVYSPAGKLISTIDVPERPNDLVFGGPDRRTLFILSHSSLYAVRTRFPGL
jgi:hypothetical protein